MEDRARRGEPDDGRGIPEYRRRRCTTGEDAGAVDSIFRGVGGSGRKIGVVHGVLED